MHTALASKNRASLRSQPLTLARAHPSIRNILRGPTIQPKLKIGAANDPAEREADAVADRVMRMPLADKATRDPSPQATAEHESSCHITLQAKAVSNGNCPSEPKNDEREPDRIAQGKEQAGGVCDHQNVEAILLFFVASHFPLSAISSDTSEGYRSNRG